MDDYLCHYVNLDQKVWSRYLDIAEFFYNLHKKDSRGFSFIELNCGVALINIIPITNIVMGRWSTLLNQTKEPIEKAQARYKKYPDLKSRYEEYEVGDLVGVRQDGW